MTTEHDQLLTETIARHFDEAAISENEVDLGVAGLHIACKVADIVEIGETRSASLFFQLWGGRLGEAPIFASVSGYGDSAEEAIVLGGCNWACTFGPVLEAALTGSEPEDADKLEVTVQGRRYAVVVDGLDRAMLSAGDDDADVGERTHAVRAHLGADPWLATRIIESGTLPVLPREHAVVLSAFCFESADQRMLEVKVNGADWAPSAHALDERPPFAGPGAAMLRELAVLVPQGDATDLSRDLLTHTLTGIAADHEPRSLVAWTGWNTHAGRRGEPATDFQVKRLEERIGRLPPDYKRFLLQVQAEGAGPGYGLIAPFADAQAKLAGGVFDWVDGERPRSEPSGVLVLAHAGCGVVWLLVVSGPHTGEVWVDGAGCDAVARRVAPSFDAWYGGWLDALVRNDELFSQWDADCCATPSVVSQLLDRMESEGLVGDAAIADLPNRVRSGAIALASGGWTYFDQGDALDPCQPCCKLVTRLGLGLDVFKPGVQPIAARAETRGH